MKGLGRRTARPRLLIVGNPDPVHVGAHLLAAASTLELEYRLCDVREAYSGPAWQQRVAWWVFGRRPSRLRDFSAVVVATARDWKADWILATGIAPIDRRALQALAELGVQRLNYLTDDPWNPVHRAPWFLEAIGSYDRIFTPRRANVEDLAALGGPRVSYVPFGYAPDSHFHDPPMTVEDRRRFDADVAFAGGADPDRVSMVTPLIEAGLNVALYGGYWERYRATSGCARGHIGLADLRKAVAGARVCLCIVRRANRDGHAMRSFEAPAMGACLLVEDTAEHREIFGEDGLAVRYFRTPKESVEVARWLIERNDERLRLAGASLARVRTEGNSYRARLSTMLDVAP